MLIVLGDRVRIEPCVDNRRGRGPDFHLGRGGLGRGRGGEARQRGEQDKARRGKAAQAGRGCAASAGDARSKGLEVAGNGPPRGGWRQAPGCAMPAIAVSAAARCGPGCREDGRCDNSRLLIVGSPRPRRTLHGMPETRQHPPRRYSPTRRIRLRPITNSHFFPRSARILPRLTADSVSAESAGAIGVVNSRELICVVGNNIQVTTYYGELRLQARPINADLAQMLRPVRPASPPGPPERQRRPARRLPKPRRRNAALGWVRPARNRGPRRCASGACRSAPLQDSPGSRSSSRARRSASALVFAPSLAKSLRR